MSKRFQDRGAGDPLSSDPCWFVAGLDAAWRQEPDPQNPHPPLSGAALEWQRGHEAGQAMIEAHRAAFGSPEEGRAAVFWLPDPAPAALAWTEAMARDLLRDAGEQEDPVLVRRAAWKIAAFLGYSPGLFSSP